MSLGFLALLALWWKKVEIIFEKLGNVNFVMYWEFGLCCFVLLNTLDIIMLSLVKISFIWYNKFIWHFKYIYINEMSCVKCGRAGWGLAGNLRGGDGVRKFVLSNMAGMKTPSFDPALPYCHLYIHGFGVMFKILGFLKIKN